MTTYLEDFNRVFIGTTAPNGATYINNGGWSINSNQGVSPAVSAWNTLVYEPGLPNPTIEVSPVYTDVDDYWGIIIRYEDTDNWIVANISNVSNDINVFRRQAGFDYTIENFNVGEPGPYPMKVEVLGDDFLCYADGVYIGTASSTFLSSSTYVGIGAFGESKFDDFSVSVVDPVEGSGSTSSDGGWGFIPIV